MMSPFLKNAAQKTAPNGPGLQPPRRMTTRRVLVVGAVRPALHGAASGDDLVVHTQLRHLSRALLDEVRPDAVVAPLITPEWDVLDLAAQLSALGYTGPLVVRSRPLPRADLVLGELQGLFPNLALAFVEDAE
jgi:hypothetical protein